MSDFANENKDKAISLAESVFVGSQTKNEKNYVLVGEKIYELEGAGWHILKCLEEGDACTVDQLFKKLESIFEDFSNEETGKFLDMCKSQGIVVCS